VSAGEEVPAIIGSWLERQFRTRVRKKMLLPTRPPKKKYSSKKNNPSQKKNPQNRKRFFKKEKKKKKKTKGGGKIVPEGKRVIRQALQPSVVANSHVERDAANVCGRWDFERKNFKYNCEMTHYRLAGYKKEPGGKLRN